MAGRGFVVYRDLGGLRGVDLDELISRQVHVIAEREIELERRAAERRKAEAEGDLAIEGKAAAVLREPA
jgi:hypothetical protein